MTKHVFLSALHTKGGGGWHSRAHVTRLRVSARAAFEQVNVSLASIQSSLLLLAEIERSESLRPVPLRLARGEALRTEPRSPPIRWDVYPAFPKSIRLGEIEAADEREAMEKAAKKFEQDPAILIVIRRA
jgi:hypothetical protein